VITFFESAAETDGAWNGLKKRRSHFNRRLGSTVVNSSSACIPRHIFLGFDITRPDCSAVLPHRDGLYPIPARKEVSEEVRLEMFCSNNRKVSKLFQIQFD